MLGSYIKVNIDAQSGLQTAENDGGLILQTGVCTEPIKNGCRVFAVSRRLLFGSVKLRVIGVIHGQSEQLFVAAPDGVEVEPHPSARHGSDGHDGEVVRLLGAKRERVDRGDDPGAHVLRRSTRAGENFLEALLAEESAVRILRLGDAVRVEEEPVAVA